MGSSVVAEHPADVRKVSFRKAAGDEVCIESDAPEDRCNADELDVAGTFASLSQNGIQIGRVEGNEDETVSWVRRLMFRRG